MGKNNERKNERKNQGNFCVVCIGGSFAVDLAASFLMPDWVAKCQ